MALPFHCNDESCPKPHASQLATGLRTGLLGAFRRYETYMKLSNGPSATQVLSGPGKNLLDLSPLDFPLAGMAWIRETLGSLGWTCLVARNGAGIRT